MKIAALMAAICLLAVSATQSHALVIDVNVHANNNVWNEVVQKAYATTKKITLQDSQAALFEHMSKIKGSIEFYSFDYWQAETGLDLIDLHRSKANLVNYRRGAKAFLAWLKRQGKRSIIATNAHPSSILVKEEVIPISDEVDAIVSSATLQAPKEHQNYWQGLQDLFPFEPERTLFIDDNEPVLDAARAFGIQHLLCVTTPDAERPKRTDLKYPAFDHFAEIYVP